MLGVHGYMGLFKVRFSVEDACVPVAHKESSCRALKNNAHVGLRVQGFGVGIRA